MGMSQDYPLVRDNNGIDVQLWVVDLVLDIQFDLLVRAKYLLNVIGFFGLRHYDQPNPVAAYWINSFALGGCGDKKGSIRVFHVSRRVVKTGGIAERLVRANRRDTPVSIG
jgi:hypothetical protein